MLSSSPQLTRSASATTSLVLHVAPAQHVHTSARARANGSRLAPYHSVSDARDALRALQPLPPGGATVLLHEGTHRPYELIGELDSGEPGAPIVYSGAPGARISAGIDIPMGAFQPVSTDDPLYHRFPDPTDVLRVNLSAHGVWDLGQPVCTPTLNLCQSGMFALNRLEVFMGGAPLHLARWPNLHGWDTTGPGGDVRSWSRTTARSTGATIGLVPEAPTAGWVDTLNAGDGDFFVKGFFGHDWSDAVIKVAQANSTTNTLTIQGPIPHYVGKSFRAGFRFFGFNSPSDLDDPGEYYLSRRGILYMIPPVTPSSSPVVLISHSQTALRLANTSFVNVESLLIEGARQRGIHVFASRNISLRNLTIRSVGTMGIHVERGWNITVSDGIIEHTGGTGIDINHVGTPPQAPWSSPEPIPNLQGTANDGQVRRLVPGGNAVLGNTIRFFGRICHAFQPGVMSNGTAVTIVGNEIAFGAHAGILPNGNDNLIEFNALHHLVMQGSDMGAIDCGGQWINRGTVIRNNLIFSIGNRADGACNSDYQYGNCSWSLQGHYGCKVIDDGIVKPTNCSTPYVYVDWSQPGWTIESNIFWQSSPTRVALDNGLHAIMLNGGRDHTVRANLFIGNFTSGVWLNDIGLQGFASKIAPGEFNVMHEVKYNQPPWSTHYPRLAHVHDYLSLPLIGNCSRDPLCPAAPFGNTYTSNVAVNQSTKLLGLATEVNVVEVDGHWQATSFEPAMIILPHEDDFDPENVNIGKGQANLHVNWQAGWTDIGVQSLALDPMRGLCLRLKHDAEIFREAAGFAPIPIEHIGTPAFRAQLPEC